MRKAVSGELREMRTCCDGEKAPPGGNRHTKLVTPLLNPGKLEEKFEFQMGNLSRGSRKGKGSVNGEIKKVILSLT